MKQNIEEKFLYKPSVKHSDAIPVWFCFPATYMIGMCSLGYLSLFRQLDEDADIYPERIFTDTDKTFHNPKDVEIMGFSVSFEFDYHGLFSILKKYNIPLRASDRGEDFPLVFGGGPVLTANPEPFADFFDFIIIGEGEESLTEIMNAYKQVRDKSKLEKLKHISQYEGVYIPSFYDVMYNSDNSIKEIKPNTPEAPAVVHRRYIKELGSNSYTPIITEKSVFPGMFLIEVARGCPKKCNFCLASYLTLPARYPLYENIISLIDKGLEYSEKIGLLGALITEHPDFEKICKYILEKRKQNKFEVSVSSLRSDKISPLMIEMLVECGQKQATIAVEAGSQRLRNFIGKKLNQEDIFAGVETARKNGLTGLKIYGMIGLPSETDEDIKELADLMIRLKKKNKGFNLTLSVSSFVPKAKTPFQTEERPPENIIKQRSEYLRKELNKNKIIYKPTSIKWDYIQAIISRGDRRLSYLAEKAYESGGTIGSWTKAYKETAQEFNLPESDWYALRKRSSSEILPWEYIKNL